MTPLETKAYLEWIDRTRPSMEAFASGQHVQYVSNVDGQWRDADNPRFATIYEYRVKPEPNPEPTLRPYTDAEMKEQVGKVLVCKRTGERHHAAYSDENYLYVAGEGNLRPFELCEWYTHVDGSPCGVTE